MFGIPIENVIPLANFIGLGILGLRAFLGQRWGQKTPTPADKTFEVAGALVDSASVKMLAASLEAQNVELAQARADAEKARKLGYEIVEALAALTKELSEVRNEMRLQRR